MIGQNVFVWVLLSPRQKLFSEVRAITCLKAPGTLYIVLKKAFTNFKSHIKITHCTFQPWQNYWRKSVNIQWWLKQFQMINSATIYTKEYNPLVKLQDRVGLSVYPPFLVSGRVRPIERIWFLAVGRRTNKLCEPRKKTLPRELRCMRHCSLHPCAIHMCF
jgi:hypothetical protein